MRWTKIGTPAHSLATFANRLVALTPNRKAIYAWDPLVGEWSSIGGAASALIGGGWDLYSVQSGTGDLWGRDGTMWRRVGDPADEFVAIAGSVYALRNQRTIIQRYNRFTSRWSTIGGPAATLIGGGANLYAASPKRRSILEYERHANRWVEIGGPGAQWVGVGGTVYGLTPDRQAVYRYDGEPGRWTKIGGPAASLIGGGEYLYAVSPGSGAILRYNAGWQEIGTPGVGFVAVGRFVWGMTPDKSQVFQYDPASAESKRLRVMMAPRFGTSWFGARVMRGFLVKRMGGAVIAEHCSDVPFQPLSMLKILPHMTALREVDAGRAFLSEKVRWVERTAVNMANGETIDDSCLMEGSLNTKVAEAPLSDALPTMMWESHNRTLDAVMGKFPPRVFTTRLRGMGLRQTEMYPECDSSSRRAPWADNVSSLTDMATLLENVAAGKWIGKEDLRDLFREYMPTNTPRVPYVSAITGRRNNGFGNGHLEAIVTRELGADRKHLRAKFLSYVRMHGKGGGGGPSGVDGGVCDLLWVRLPFKVGGRVVLRDYIIGLYYWQFTVPYQSAIDDEMRADRPPFLNEAFTLPVREAVKTW
jgi:hypothetical protein